ncbi:MAG: hypothetical protein HOV68_25025 [Streptomycetaceae bacterium]|nr:hypothetical protein [Streptomycetaceae bacterium]
MSEQVRTTNVDRVFAVVDDNGDGHIEWADLAGKSDPIGREFGFTPDAPQVGALRDAYRQLWEYICDGADVDRDGVVTREEFERAHLEERLSTDTIVDLWANASDRCFELMDRDGDGYIGREELATLYRAAGVPGAERVVEVAFAGMDVNSDGRVDQVEFTANVRGLFTATDASSKGAAMLGD